ncbi:MAG: peptide chain release factor N(5)-glutamine methyltransferase [Synergistes sp.]|nr:peptide chain release factor N(5)-glutamine methyltransferase [Synergistes sp.]
MKVQALRRRVCALLSDAESARPAYAADLIISHRAGISRAELIYRDDDIPADICCGIFSAAAKRAKGVPLSYVLHEAEFYGYVFKVGRGVLIPRPETELLVEEALKYFPAGRAARFADWCTGSGCIAAALLMENPSLSGIAVDKSRQALRWAGINVRRLDLAGRLELIRNDEPGDAPVEEGSLDFITANPPYIPAGEIGGLMSEVRSYEPHAALDGGCDGLFLYRKFFAAFPRFLKSGGMMFFECAGGSQAEALSEMCKESFELEDRITDYNGKLRHLVWRRR